MEKNIDRAGLTIGLCDDEIYIKESLEKLIGEYARSRNVFCRFIYYSSPKKLLAAKDCLDFLFLDIEMPEMDGIDAAFLLRARGVKYKIVMLTAREDRYRDAFRIGAFRFIPKPIVEEEVFQVIDEVRQHMVGNTPVEVFQNGVKYNILQKDIYFVEADNHGSLVFSKRSEYSSPNTIALWEKQLDKRCFFRCHKSFLVNMEKIEKIDKDTISLVSGDIIKVSRRQKTMFLRAFMEFDTSRR